MSITRTLSKIRRDPLGAIKRAFFKVVVGPLRYRRGDDYDAERYWSDRLKQYGSSLQGPGDEGLPHTDNEQAYERAAAIVFSAIDRSGIDLARAEVLEVGSGNGYYTQLLLERGTASLRSMDITDVMFDAISAKVAPILATTNATFALEKLDVTTQKITGAYDLILFVDVIEHIITKPKLAYALTNLAAAAKPGGLLVLAPVAARSRSHLFHNSDWDMSDIQPFFADWDIGSPVPFRGTNLVTARRRTSHEAK